MISLKGRSGWIGAGLVLGVLTVIAGVSLISQTRWGRERALTFTLSAVSYTHLTLPTIYSV